jgi:hypothetical protein
MKAYLGTKPLIWLQIWVLNGASSAAAMWVPLAYKEMTLPVWWAEIKIALSLGDIGCGWPLRRSLYERLAGTAIVETFS